MRAVILLILIPVLGGCWEDQPSKVTQDYMSTLNHCPNDCKTDSPILGGGDNGR